MIGWESLRLQWELDRDKVRKNGEDEWGTTDFFFSFPVLLFSSPPSHVLYALAAWAKAQK